METTLQKWGNSNGIRIPSAILKSLKLKTNDKVDMVLDGNKIIITKIEKEKHFSLKERIDSYDGPNIIEQYDWGEPKGKEIW